MEIVNLGFLFILLPISAIAYYIMPKVLKSATLLIISLGIYLFGQRWALPIMVLNVALDYLSVRLMWRYEHQSIALRKIFLASVLKNIALIISLGIIYPISTGNTPPLGVVVVSLSAISYVVSLYKGRITGVDNLINFSLYCFFFAKLQHGPVEDPVKLMPQIRKPASSIDTIADGVRVLCLGLAKKVLIADQLAGTINDILQLPMENITLLSSLMLLISKFLWIFFVLSGFSDIAQGIAQIFSIKLPNNVTRPLQGKSVFEYIHGLNVSFGQFFESALEVNNPQTHSRKIKAKVLIVFISALIIGMFLSPSKFTVLWAVVMAGLTWLQLTAEKHIPLPWVLSLALTAIVCLLATVLLIGVNTEYMRAILNSVLSYQNASIYNTEILYIISYGYIVFIAAVVGATGLLELIGTFLKQKLPEFYGVILSAYDILLMVLVTSFMMMEVM